MNLSKNVKIMGSSLGVIAAATTTINSAWVDTQGFNGCMCIVRGSTLATSTATVTLTAVHAASRSTLVQGILGTVTSTAHNVAAGTNRNFSFDVYKPTKRYLRFGITGSSAGTYEFVQVLYEPYRPGSSACGPASTTTWAGSTVVAGKAT